MDATRNGTAPDTLSRLREVRRKVRLKEAELTLAHLERVGRRQGTRPLREGWEGGPLCWEGAPGGEGPGGIDSDRYLWPGQADFAWHRMWGWNWPFWRTWIEHARYRFAARTLHGYFGVAKGLLRALSGYIVGKGIPYRVVARNGRTPPDELLRVCSDAYDEFNEENDWHGLQKELFLRSRRDGEYFLRWFPQDDGPLALRTLEPAEIVEPQGNDPRTTSFGIVTPPDDIYGRLGYCWSWDGSAIDVRDAIPAAEVDHVTVNVDRHIKRGLSDFFGDVYDGLKIASETVQAMAESARVQAEIAFIVQHSTATPEQVGSFVGGIEPAGGPHRRRRGGIREDIDKGQEYVDPPFAANAAGFVEVLQARYRSVGVAWNLPEGITSGDWSNNNFASALMAESPFVKTAVDEQAFYDRRFKRTGVAALRHAANEGRIVANGHRYTWREVRELVDLQGEPPTIETRDMLKEAQTNQILAMAQVQSPQTWQQKLGLDPEQEQQNFEEFQERTGGLGTQLPDDPDKGGGQDRPQSRESVRETKDANGQEHDAVGRFGSGGGGGGKQPKKRIFQRGQEIAEKAHKNSRAILGKLKSGSIRPDQAEALADLFGDKAIDANHENYKRRYAAFKDRYADAYGYEAIGSPEWDNVIKAFRNSRDGAEDAIRGLTSETSDSIKQYAATGSFGNSANDLGKAKDAIDAAYVAGAHAIGDAADAFVAKHKAVKESADLLRELGEGWIASDHPRGQPDNKGQFGSGGGGKGGGAKGDSAPKLSKMQAAAKEAVGKIKRTKQRAFEGQPTEGHVKLSKQLAGAIGEEIVIQHLKSKGFKDAQPFSTWLRSEQNNLPIDLIQDHEVIEAKTGQASNGPGAQQWRLTIGEPGKEQKEWLKTANEEDKAKANAEKQEAIHARKNEMIAHVTKELGKPIKGRTMTVILNPDTKTADLYSFDGFHDRIGWTSDAAKKAYIGSVTYGGK